MACPRRQLSTPLFLSLLTAFVASPTFAQVKPCEELRDEIAEKIRNNGVPAFDLFILGRDEATPWKIVGTCNGGRDKIAYARGTAREQAATLKALEASGEVAPAVAAAAERPERPPAATATPPVPRPAQAPSVSSERAAATTMPPSSPPSSPAAAPTPTTKPSSARGTDNPGASLWSAGETRQCHMARPKGWLTDRTLYGDAGRPPAVGAPIRAFEIDMLPPSGDALALKGVVFSFRIRPHYLHELRPLMIAAYQDAAGFNAMVKEPITALGGDELDFRSSMASHATASPDEWKRARSVASSPGLIDGVGVVRLQVIQDVDWKPIDAFSFRAREQGEEASGVTTHRIGIWSDGKTLRTQAVLNPVYRSPTGGGSLTERLVYEYGCWASNALSTRDMASICSSFIERSTLGPEFPAASCVAAADGIDYAAR